MTVILLLFGFTLLIAGGEALVRGAVGIAARMRVSPLLIGLTVVGFGTSTPELVTSLQAAWQGAPGIAVGNVVGSNIANVALILGLTVLIAPMAVAWTGFRRDGIALAVATALCLGVVIWGTLDRSLGALLIAALVGYVWIAYRGECDAPRTEADGIPDAPRAAWVGPLLTLAGIALVILGAPIAVGAAVVLAEAWGLSETVVGLTIVAVGTSLPELVTSVMAALRRQPGLALGNVVGSNIYNVLGILGVTALVTPIAVPERIAGFDIWVMAATSVVLIALVAWHGRIGRAAGAALLLGYGAYTAWLVLGA